MFKIYYKVLHLSPSRFQRKKRAKLWKKNNKEKVEVTKKNYVLKIISTGFKFTNSVSERDRKRERERRRTAYNMCFEVIIKMKNSGENDFKLKQNISN